MLNLTVLEERENPSGTGLVDPLAPPPAPPTPVIVLPTTPPADPLAPPTTNPLGK